MKEQIDIKNKIIKGMPPPILLPAKNYLFKVSNENFIIELPRSGKYYDLDPDFFTEDSGEFNIFNEENKILYMTAITKVLFATSKYPDLKFNQFFAPYSIKIEEDKVLIVGMVLDMQWADSSDPEEEIEN